jgi:hypothetical protein
VLLDPAFTIDEQDKVVAGLATWESAVPVKFSLRITSCSGIHDATICIHASNHDEIAAKQSAADGIGLGLTLREKTWSHVIDGGEVFIDVPTIEAQYAVDFQRIVAHEVGHAMQLDHDAYGNLMAAMATEDAPFPMCADEAEWYAVRNDPGPQCD